MVHATLSWVTRHEFSQRSTQEGLHDGDKNEPVDDGTWTTGVDLSDNTQPKTRPGDGRRRCKPDQ